MSPNEYRKFYLVCYIIFQMTHLTVEPSDVYAIVQTNASILSIIIGFISAYALYVFTKEKEFEIQIMQEVEKINLIPHDLPSLSISSIQIDTHDENRRTQLIHRLRDISMGIPNATMISKSILAEFNCLDPNPGRQLTASNVGLEARIVLTLIFKNYPFADVNPSYNPDGKVVTLTSVSQAHQWARDTESLLYFLLWCFESNGQRLQNAVDSYTKLRK